MRLRTCPVLAPPRHASQCQAIAPPLSFAPAQGGCLDLRNSTKPPPVRAREQSRSRVGAACRSVLLSGYSTRLYSRRAGLGSQPSQFQLDRSSSPLQSARFSSHFFQPKLPPSLPPRCHPA